jgi:hypothetical protein
MKMYELTIRVDQQWMDILDQISKHQNGFIWVAVKADNTIDVESSNG